MGFGELLVGGLAATLVVGPGGPRRTDPVLVAPSTVKPGCVDEAEKAEPPCQTDPNLIEGVTVRGERGKSESMIAPEITLDEEAIQAYGANSIAELLAAIAPLTATSRGRVGNEAPVILVNGQRTSGLQELRGVPPEAIQRLDILREEAALAYGFRADQRVVNLTLKKDFKAATFLNDDRWASEGGRASTEQQVNLFKVTTQGRWTIDMRYHLDSPLYEEERAIVRAAPGAPYSLTGALASASFGGEIDPNLSKLVGSIVTTSAVPQSANLGPPILADFVPLAGKIPTDGLVASRSLLPRTRTGSVEGAYTRNFKKTTATFSASLQSTSNTSYQGLPGVMLTVPETSPFSPFSKDVVLYRYYPERESLRRNSRIDRVQAGTVLLGGRNGWRWTFASNFDRADSKSRTGRGIDFSALQAAVLAGAPSVNPFGQPAASLLRRAPQDVANSIATNARAELTVVGRAAELPAGALRTTLRVGVDRQRLDSDSTRSGIRTVGVLTRDRGSVQASIEAPLSSRAADVMPALGDVLVNANLLYERFSDLDGLITAGGGVTWLPVRRFSLSANYSFEEGEAALQLLNAPLLQTPNVAMYDFATGQTVNVNVIEGGNRGLKSDSRQVFKLGFNFKPFEGRELQIYGNYTASRIDDPIYGFPAVSPELERAFPERFTRDASGRLISVDTRSVNFARADRQEVRWGFTFSRRWARGSSATPGRAATGASTRASGPAAAFMGALGGGDLGAAMLGRGFFQLSVNHLWRLKDDVLISAGMPVIDLLDGASLGQRGGTPRHEVTIQGTFAQNGYGSSFRAAWKSSTRINGGASGGNLHFSDIPTIAISAYVDLNSRKALSTRYPWVNGARLSIGVDNAFNTKQRVRDGRGLTPQAYQPDYMDPLGRVWRASLRKQF